MPVYEYQCMECSEVFEIFHRIDETYESGCPRCQGEAKKILSPSNFILKGSGFYVNDYPSESRKKEAESSEKKPKESGPAKEKKPAATAENP